MQFSNTSACEALRVAVIASSLRRAGAEKQTVYICRALFQTGIDARFFHVGESGHYSEVLRGLGIPFQQIYRAHQPLFMLGRVTAALSRFRPHIVFVPQFGDLLQGGIPGRCCSALVLGGVRSDGFYELDASRRRSPWMLRLAHGLVANSQCARHNLASRGANPEKIRVLPNVIDLDEFDTRSKLALSFALPANRFIAAAVGSLQPCKRFDRFLTALTLARRKVPTLLGVIAGADRGSREALEEQAEQCGLTPNNLQFVGECDNVPSLLAQAGCLVLCSDYEGFPNVILEAMSARLPVITTPVGDAARIVKCNETGYVVDSDDISGLADRLVELALSAESRARLGTEGRNLVARKYSYGSLPLRLLSVFRDFAAQSRRRRLEQVLESWMGGQEQNSFSGRPLFSNSMV